MRLLNRRLYKIEHFNDFFRFADAPSRRKLALGEARENPTHQPADQKVTAKAAAVIASVHVAVQHLDLA
jgi:hypothetical protein